MSTLSFSQVFKSALKRHSTFTGWIGFGEVAVATREPSLRIDQMLAAPAAPGLVKSTWFEA